MHISIGEFRDERVLKHGKIVIYNKKTKLFIKHNNKKEYNPINIV